MFRAMTNDFLPTESVVRKMGGCLRFFVKSGLVLHFCFGGHVHWFYPSVPTCVMNLKKRLVKWRASGFWRRSVHLQQLAVFEQLGF